jgi:hypothetical protein
MSASNVHVQQALAAQQAKKLAGNRAPPFWAILAILFLGWNEFMAVLFNPVRNTSYCLKRVLLMAEAVLVTLLGLSMLQQGVMGRTWMRMHMCVQPWLIRDVIVSGMHADLPHTWSHTACIWTHNVH